MSKQVRIGIIGSGGMARHHMGQLKNIEGVEVTALCDINPSQIALAKETYPYLRNAFETPDYKALLAREDVDAVQIITPHTQHFDQVNAAMEKLIRLHPEQYYWGYERYKPPKGQ